MFGNDENDEKYMHEEVKSRLTLENAYYYAIPNP
jgi:hypothetical protein